jgi:predicted enzyme related to lactoylglutathione lyase
VSKVVHFEIPAQDTGRAREFWGSLFGLKFES